MVDTGGHDLRQAMNYTEHEHQLHQLQTTLFYNGVMPIELQNAPPSYDEVMQNGAAYNLNPDTEDNDIGNDGQNVFDQINLTSSNLGQIPVSYNHPAVVTDNTLAQADTPYTQNPNLNKDTRKRNAFIIFCCFLALLIIAIIIKKSDSRMSVPNADILPCLSFPCRNGGYCRDTEYCSGGTCTVSYSCFCTHDYYGANCDSVTDPCTSSPCENGGTCEGKDRTEYTCNCPDCCMGTNCEIRKGCLINRCQNGGLCNIIHDGAYICRCPLDFIGPYCEHNNSKIRPD